MPCIASQEVDKAQWRVVAKRSSLILRRVEFFDAANTAEDAPALFRCASCMLLLVAAAVIAAAAVVVVVVVLAAVVEVARRGLFPANASLDLSSFFLFLFVFFLF